MSQTPQPTKPIKPAVAEHAAAPAVSEIPLHRERPSWVTLVLPALFLVVLTAGVYLPALHGPFTFDDQPLLFGQSGVLSRASDNLSSLWYGQRPLSDVSYYLNARIAGPSPESFRIVNIALHILAGLVLLDLVRRTLASPRFNMRWVTLATPLAAVIAGLWMIHPLQTQAVSYIAQRSEVMATLFIFMSLNALAMAAGGGRCASLVKAGVVFACVAAMFSKQIGFVTPVLLLLYDRTFWAGSFKASFKQRPLLHVAALLTLLFPWVMGLNKLVVSSTAGGQGGVSAGIGTRGISSSLYFFSEQSILVHYLQLIFWPATLVLDYRYAVMEPAILPGLPSLAHGLSLALMLALGVLTAWALWRRPAWGFLGVWFFLLLAPTSSFLPIADLAMEHRVYGGSAAVIAATVMGITMLLLWSGRRKHYARSNARLIGMMLFLTAISALSVRTVYRNMDYASELRLWGKAHQDRPSNTRAMLVLGKLVEPRNPLRALELYQLAARTEPGNYEPMIALGSFYLMNNAPAEAGKWYEVSYRTSGDRLTYYLNMGMVAEAKKDLQAAAHFLSQALIVSPGNLQILTNFGMVLDQLANERLNAGDAAGAMSLRQNAVASQEKILLIEPTHEKAQMNLATALVNMGMQQMLAGDGKGAAASLSKSLSVQGRSDTARRLAWLLATWPEALTNDWEAVVRLARDAEANVEGRQPLYLETTAAALARAGQYTQASAVQKHAYEVAVGAGLGEARLAQLKQRLLLYENGKPYLHQPNGAERQQAVDSNDE